MSHEEEFSKKWPKGLKKTRTANVNTSEKGPGKKGLESLDEIGKVIKAACQAEIPICEGNGRQFGRSQTGSTHTHISDLRADMETGVQTLERKVTLLRQRPPPATQDPEPLLSQVPSMMGNVQRCLTHVGHMYRVCKELCTIE